MIVSSNGISSDRGAVVGALAFWGKGLVLLSILATVADNSLSGTFSIGIVLGVCAAGLSYPLALTQTSAPGTLEVGSGARVAAVVELAEERLAGGAAPERAAAFERGDRDVAAWRAQIRAALAPGYRASGASVEDATAVLASASSTVEQRLGAALALRVAGEPPGRVRIAAEGAASPQVRVALEAIAEDADDERLEKVLRRLR